MMSTVSGDGGGLLGREKHPLFHPPSGRSPVPQTEQRQGPAEQEAGACTSCFKTTNSLSALNHRPPLTPAAVRTQTEDPVESGFPPEQRVHPQKDIPNTVCLCLSPSRRTCTHYTIFLAPWSQSGGETATVTPE